MPPFFNVNFEISSPSFFEAGRAYYQSKQEMHLAEKTLKRQKTILLANNRREGMGRLFTFNT